MNKNVLTPYLILLTGIVKLFIIGVYMMISISIYLYRLEESCEAKVFTSLLCLHITCHQGVYVQKKRRNGDENGRRNTI